MMPSMEPITVASAFASILGLLAVFKDQRDARDSKSLDQYVDWLRRHEHGQLVELIQGNRDLEREIQSLLEGQHDELMAKLRGLDAVLAGVASRIEGFEGLANAIRVTETLSDQAVSILCQMNEANASIIVDFSSHSGRAYKALDGSRAVIQLSDARFAKADIETLCDLGLLFEVSGNQGGTIYGITREGAAVGEGKS